MAGLLTHLPRLAMASLLATQLSGCVLHVSGNGEMEFGGVSSVFGNVSVSEGKHVTDVSSVNGNIELEDNVSAQNVDTVNGNIEIGDHVSVRKAETVNGDISTGTHFVNSGSTETVNGGIRIEPHGQIGNNVKTVNGDIELKHVKVGGNVVTNNGDIYLTDHTQVEGDVIFRKNDRRRDRHEPTLRVAETVRIGGEILLYRDVELQIDNPQLQNKVRRMYE